ncbi:MAG: type III pantothenate kinase [Candidatus Limnocylindria bacterium]
MLLALDVGNTNVVLGAYRGADLVRTWRAATQVDRTEDEMAVMIDGLLAREDLGIDDIDSMVVGSVVPPLTLALTRFAERHLEGRGTDGSKRCLVIGPGIKTGVRLRVDNPSEVGADRIANTLAAHRRYGGPAVIVDFGTSTNFDVVSGEGDFLGGSFAPGVEIAAESLFGRASRLFRVPLTPPREAIGKNTADCLRSGIVFGYVGLVEGLIERIVSELAPSNGPDHERPRVIATGGLASTIAPLTKSIERVDEDLTLEGLRMLWDLNAA